MCLDTITSTNPPPEGVGYKVFRKYGRFLSGEWTSGKRPTKQWLKSAGNKSNGGASKIKDYDWGFHVYKTLRFANIQCCSREVVRKVRYRKAFVEGRRVPYIRRKGQVSLIVVAKEIYIIPGEVK